jgi:hypothetical protein
MYIHTTRIQNENKPQKPNSISPIITKTTNPILMTILDFSLLRYPIPPPPPPPTTSPKK